MSDSPTETENGRLSLLIEGLRTFFRRCTIEALDNAVTLGCVAVYVVSGALLVHRSTARPYLDIFDKSLGYSAGSIVLLLIGLPIVAMTWDCGRQPFRSIIRAYGRLLHPRAWEQGLWVVIVFGPMAAVFMQMKSLLGAWAFGSWDSQLAWLDCTLHSGCPQLWLLPSLASPGIYFAVSMIYGVGWFVLSMGFVAYLALLAPADSLRSRTLFVYLLAWIIPGTLVAWFGYSGGPAFYSLFTGVNGPYADFLGRLEALDQQTTLSAMTLMHQMAEAYRESPASMPPGLGISAMPSMHISMVALVTLYSRHVSRFAFTASIIGLCFYSYAAVALGWHYALDVYAALILTASLWWLAGHISFDLWSQRRHKQGDSPQT